MMPKHAEAERPQPPRNPLGRNCIGCITLHRITMRL